MARKMLHGKMLRGWTSGRTKDEWTQGKEGELRASPLWVTPQRLATNLVFLFLHRSSQTTSLSSAPWLRPSPSVSIPVLFS